MQKGPPTPKGFRDIGPDLAKKRREVINTIIVVLEEFGFEPIETPTIEFASTLKGKYGEEERLIYEFKDRGGRDLALRYDLTVPLARFVANNQQLIAKGPFRRYQIGQVFRGENPQAGRWREFTQFDLDTVGSSDIKEDAKIVITTIKSARTIGVTNAQMAINDRRVLSVFAVDEIRVIDKVHKIGIDGVRAELEVAKKTNDKINIDKVVDYLKNDKPQTPAELKDLFETLKSEGLSEGKDFFFDHTLARGLDYYTGAIFELKPDGNPSSLSIGAGGRYDNLISMFAGKQIPAVGFSFGIDRLIDVLQS